MRISESFEAHWNTLKRLGELRRAQEYLGKIRRGLKVLGYFGGFLDIFTVLKTFGIFQRAFESFGAL